MHSWEVIPQTNYEHNWFGSNLKQLKSEPQDMSYSSQQPNSPQSMDGQSADQLHHHNHHLHHQNTPASLQSQSSPSMMFCDSSNMVNGGRLTGGSQLQQTQHMGFNPLTPPGYPGAMIMPPQQSQQPNQQTNNSTPFRNFSAKGNLHHHHDVLGFGSTNNGSNLTPSHTPPMDVTPPKSPKYNANETPEKDLPTTVTASLASAKNAKNEKTPPPPTSTPPTTTAANNLTNTPAFDSGDESRSMADSDLCERGLMDEVDIDDDLIEDEDEDIRTPKVNSHGKMKKFKCKQCDFIAFTKLSFWEHTRSHIKPEKMLKCQKCPFVTEYKHHLEYHMRNHNGSKPFQCNQCSYSCVNKSMLNSHMKSHSNVYQYRCQDCSYATKYCHSLKLHLRKYSHSPAMVLNSDGTPNPLPIIDVYGTRRGPKVRKTSDDQPQTPGSKEGVSKKKRSQGVRIEQQQQQPQSSSQAGNGQEEESRSLQPYQDQNAFSTTAAATQQLPNPAALAMLPNLAHIFQQNPNMPLFPYLNLNFHHMLAVQQQHKFATMSQISPTSSNDDVTVNEDSQDDNGKWSSALDLTNPCTPSLNATSSAAANKNKRKGRAVKLELMKGSSDDDEESGGRDKKQVQSAEEAKIVPPQSPSSSTTPHKSSAGSMETSQQQQPQQPPKHYECKFCDITFKHLVLHTIHMGYHGYNDVFKCNMCGEKCEDRVAFFLHIARDAHHS